MNTNDKIQTIINKLPITLFFKQQPDRKQALLYLEWITKNNPESKTLNEDKLFREIINKELRIINMKVTELEILFMVALNNITLNDFTIDSDTLIKTLISENKEKYELDTMYRIMSQIMSKLPRDLKERVTGKQKLELFQKISQLLTIDNKLLEKFMELDPTFNTPISMELDSGDYNTLHTNYLEELHKYEKSKGYINSNSMEYGLISKDIIENNDSNEEQDILKAEYIDEHPEFMLGTNDNTLYYFDSSSGSLTEIPLNSNHTAVSIKDLKTILMSNKVNKNEIQDLINDLQTKNTSNSKNIPTLLSEPTATEKPSNFFDTIGSYFTSFMSSEATATSTSQPNTIPQPTVEQLDDPKLKILDSTFLSDATIYNNINNSAPLPPHYIKKNNSSKSNYYKKYIEANHNNINKRYNEREQLYEQESFTNQTNAEEEFLNKIKTDNKNIENTALGFVSVIIILFLLFFFNSIKNNNKK